MVVVSKMTTSGSGRPSGPVGYPSGWSAGTVVAPATDVEVAALVVLGSGEVVAVDAESVEVERVEVVGARTTVGSVSGIVLSPVVATDAIGVSAATVATVATVSGEL